MLVRFTSIIATIGLLSASVNAYGMIAQVVDASDFCVFLPPDDATDRIISDSEWDANAFCMGSTPLATNAGKLPSGFIRSAHFVKTDAYVQVTGQIDYTKANLDGTDGGGQMDIKAPTGSSCAGWDYYVNLIEPSTNTYCIRCCNDTQNCNRGISQDGCAKIIPGDYSGPNDGTGAAISSGSSSSSSVSPSATVSSTSSSVPSSTTTSSAVTSSSVVSTTSHTLTSSSSASASSSAPSGVVSAQSVNSAISYKPTAAALGAGLVLSIAMLS
ncbi:unnamed protein product [Mucor hiemalis]